MEVDVPKLFADFPLAARRDWPGSPPPFHRVYSAAAPLGARLKLWKLLHRTHLDQRWLARFAEYWVGILGGRPLLAPEDFHFLRGIYRMRHQEDAIDDTADASRHLLAWQKNSFAVYQLFAQQFFESIDPRLAEAQWLHRLGVRSFIEYGAASAPVTTAYRQFFGTRAASTIVDLEQIAFHFGAYKFKADPTVTPVALTPATDLLPDTSLRADAIVCKATFEHLKDPLEVARRFAAMLNPRGYLLFDFLHSPGGGMDTLHAVRQRDAVLAFIDERFEKIHGDARQAHGSRLTVARLR